MSNETPRLNLDTFEPGDTDWDHTDTVEAVDEQAIERGLISERPTEGKYDDELYYATDQNVLWGWSESASDWSIRGGTGSEDQALPAIYTERAENEQTLAPGDFSLDETDEDGWRKELEPFSNTKIQGMKYQVLDRQLTSWPMRLPRTVARLPYNRSKARVTLMHDWDDETHYTELSSLYEERGMPWTGNFSWHRVRDSENSWVDLDDLEEMVRSGLEVGIYPRDSTGENLQTIEDDDPQKVVEFLLSVRRDFENEGFPISYVQFRQGQGIGWNDTDEPKSHTIRSAFIASGSGPRPNPDKRIVPPMLSNNPGTWSGDWRDMTTAEFEELIDKVVAVGGDITLFSHQGEIEEMGYDEYADRLDYLEQYREDGDLEITTQTGMQWIPGDADAINAVSDPLAEHSATYSIEDFWDWTSGSPSVGTDGGSEGDNYYVLGDGDEIGLLQTGLELDWQSVTVDFMARAPDGETAEVSVAANPQESDVQGARRFDAVEIGDSWERVFQSYGQMSDVTRLLARIIQEAGTVYVDEVKIYPV